MDAIQAPAVLQAAQQRARQTILFLDATPLGNDRGELDQEARALQIELERCGYRDQFELVTRWAVEPLDLLRELRKLKPTIVHFSGRAGCSWASERRHGVWLRDHDAGSRLVSAAALQQVFGAAGESVRLVVLSACYNELQAKAILAHVDCVVGVGEAVREEAARIFAVGFYGGLGECESVAAAFRQGVAAISISGLSKDERLDAPTPSGSIPQLLTRSGVDPCAINIIHKRNERTRCSIVIKADLKEFDVEVISRVRDELRRLSGDVSLEITEITEGSVRLTTVLSPEAAARLETLRKEGEFQQLLDYDVFSLTANESEGSEFATAQILPPPLPASLAHVDLHRADLCSADLGSADLRGAKLGSADLRRANLAGANLAGANLAEANLAEANLAEANLAGADLAGANLAGANLAGANLVGANLAGANLVGADLVRADLNGAKLDRTDLYGADLSAANLVNVDLSGANLSKANLRGAALSALDLPKGWHVETDRSGGELREAMQNPAEVATALLIERTLRNSPAYRKLDDSLYVVKQGSVYVMVNVVPWGDNRAMVRFTAQLVKGVDVDGPLAKQLLELNSHLRFGAFALDPAEHAVLFQHTILGGTTLDAEELHATLRDVALIADRYDEQLTRYGGRRMSDVLEERPLESILGKHAGKFDD